MRITFLIWVISRKGGTRVILKVADGLARRGHEVNIVTLGGKSWFPIKAKIQYRSKLPADWKPMLPISVLSLSQKLPASDITVATFFPTAYSMYLGGRGILCYYIQHYEPLLYSNPFVKFLAHMSYRFPFNWIVNSTWVRQVLENIFNKQGSLVHPGIDLDVFHPREVPKSGRGRMVVCLGRRRAIKGFQNAVEAMKIVRKKHPDVKLVLFGSEPGVISDVPLPCEYVFKPSDEELATLYSSAQVVLSPSWYESFPLPPLEAMACGAPVVATRYGTEDYAINEVNSLVVYPKNSKALAEAILRILTDRDLAERLRKAGLETAKRFTWKKTVDKLERIFARLGE